MDYIKLSKEVSYALRHAPWEYELELDGLQMGTTYTIDVEAVKVMIPLNNFGIFKTRLRTPVTMPHKAPEKKLIKVANQGLSPL